MAAFYAFWAFIGFLTYIVFIYRFFTLRPIRSRFNDPLSFILTLAWLIGSYFLFIWTGPFGAVVYTFWVKNSHPKVEDDNIVDAEFEDIPPKS